MMKRKILVTGGGGFAAGNIIRRAGSNENIDIHAIELHKVAMTQDRLTWYQLDLLDSTGLKEIFGKVKPDVLIHAAAVSDIDYCQVHQDVAAKVNVGVTELLISLCDAFNCRFIYFSSDSVFDGEKGNYTEEDQPKPVNFYAATKISSENFIKQRIDNWVILRPSLILGFPVAGTGNSFLWRMEQSLQKNLAVAFPKTEIRSPVDVITLSDAILELASNTFTGILHLSGNNAVSRYDMALRITRRLGYPVELVVDQKPAVASGRAPRPRDVSLCNDLAKSVLRTPLRDLDEEIDLILGNRSGISP
jgi:dTDP-4-dehydrorhamnose reductase